MIIYSDDEMLPISGLQHLSFCSRQCALIHLERVWADNYLTASGNVMHERVHNAPSESRGDVRTARGLLLRSSSLGLTGIADIVEFHRIDVQNDGIAASCNNETDTQIVFNNESVLNFPMCHHELESVPVKPQMPSSSSHDSDQLLSNVCKIAVHLPKKRGLWRPYPVEYKRGNPKQGNCDAVQLCAQAICLEEMLHCYIPEAALFYGQMRRRVIVHLDDSLRKETEMLAKAFHALIDSGHTPPPNTGPKCKACSLKDDCLPDLKKTMVLNYLHDQWKEAESSS